MEDTFVIGYDIFTAIDGYNHDDYYSYAKDEDGNLIKCHYGNDGDGDWYITFFEIVESETYVNYSHDELTFYKNTGRLPFEYVTEFSWDEVEGLSLNIREIDGVQTPCLIRWSDNKCYVIKPN